METIFLKGSRSVGFYPQSTLFLGAGIDILVSNAAANPHMGSILDCGEDAWDKIFDINVKSALMLTQLCVPHMIERGGGSIVYVTSIAGSCWTALRGGC